MQQVLLYFTLSLLSYPPPEQVAFDYFTKNIIRYKYSETKTVYFSGYSEPRENIQGPFSDCFGSDYFTKHLYYQKDLRSSAIPIEYSQNGFFKKRRRPGRGKLYLRIYRTVEEPDFSYTYIKVYKMHYFVDHYLIKSSTATKEVIGLCRKGEII